MCEHTRSSFWLPLPMSTTISSSFFIFQLHCTTVKSASLVPCTPISQSLHTSLSNAFRLAASQLHKQSPESMFLSHCPSGLATLSSYYSCNNQSHCYLRSPDQVRNSPPPPQSCLFLHNAPLIAAYRARSEMCFLILTDLTVHLSSCSLLY